MSASVTRAGFRQKCQQKHSFFEACGQIGGDETTARCNENGVCCENHQTFPPRLPEARGMGWMMRGGTVVEVSAVQLPGILIKVLKFNCLYDGLGAFHRRDTRPTTRYHDI